MGVDYRGFLSTKKLTSGTGITVVESGGASQIGVDSATVALKGSGYTASRAAVIDSSGNVTAASGTASDCVKVDGSSGACGGGTTPEVISTAGVGAYYPFGFVHTDGDGSKQVVDVVNRTFFFQMVLPFKATLGKLAFKVATIHAGAGIRFGIYNTACNAILTQTAALTTGYTDATGVKNASFTAAATLDPGIYYIAVTSDSTTLKVTKYHSYEHASVMIGNEVAMMGGQGSNSTGSGDTLALPASCGTISKFSGTNNYAIAPIIALGR
jgi:hypothetical protein